MIAKATLRYIRISPRKVRQVIPLIKGKRAEVAVSMLFSIKKRASEYLIDLIESALANAKRVQGVDSANLFISRLVANGGPQLKRFRAGSMGRAGMIRKRTSHVTVELDEIAKQETPANDAARAQVKKPREGRIKVKGARATGKAAKAVKAAKPESKKGKE
jgi:large subunit ribosomal protein L22